MVAGDKSEAKLDSINEDCSDKSVQRISPKLDLLEPLKSNTDKILSVLKVTSDEKDEKDTTSILDTLVTKEDFRLKEDANEVTSSSIKEGLLTIKDVLASFGLEEGAEPNPFPSLAFFLKCFA